VLDKLSVDDFTPAVGQRFVADLDGTGSLDLELVKAATFEAGAAARDESGTRSPFNVQFRGPAEPILPQRIYRLENDHVGTLEIFLVPIGNDGSATSYEAVFA
jgi:hypothetical protein